MGSSIQEFNNRVREIIIRNTIRLDPRNKYVPKMWWNDKVQKMFRIRQATRAKYFKSITLQDLRAHRKAEDAPD